MCGDVNRKKENILGKRARQCKGPKVGMSLEHLRKRKEPLQLECDREKEKGVGSDTRSPVARCEGSWWTGSLS